MRVFVGVDGGGSKTTAAVCDVEGRLLGRAVAGPSNHNAIGIEVAAERVLAAISEAVHVADGPIEIAGLCLALAGVARPEDHAAWRSVVGRWVEAAQLDLAIGAERATITHDAMAALVGGTGKREGVVVIAGTGAIAFGANARGHEARASGWGYLLGDEGSGYWIGLEGLRAVLRAEDGRGPATALRERLLAAKGLNRPQQLIKPMYAEWKPVDVAALAPAVLEVAAGGDVVAGRIVVSAAAELGSAASAVLRQLELLSTQTEVVAAGGLWDGPLLRQRFAAQLRESAPLAEVISPRAEPVIGALMLARGAV
jgi:N-acetylglucosamine kinase